MYFPHNLVDQYSSYVYCIFMYLQYFDTAALQTVLICQSWPSTPTFSCMQPQVS